MDNKGFMELIGFIIMIGGLVWNLAYQRGKSEQIEENLNLKIDQHILDDGKIELAMKSQVEKIWTWKDKHEQEAVDMRFELQRQIGKIEGAVAVTSSQYIEILRHITSLTTKIDKLETQIEKSFGK